MAKPFLLTYPDKSKRHLTRSQRDSLLFSGEIKEIAPKAYFYIGPVHTLHSMPELKVLAIVATGESTAFLEGRFVFVAPGGRKFPERLESVGAMTARLIKQGLVAA